LCAKPKLASLGISYSTASLWGIDSKDHPRTNLGAFDRKRDTTELSSETVIGWKWANEPNDFSVMREGYPGCDQHGRAGGAVGKLNIDASERTSGDRVKTVMITDPDGNDIAFAEPIDSSLAQ
jgi:hypothetical protein